MSVTSTIKCDECEHESSSGDVGWAKVYFTQQDEKYPPGVLRQTHLDFCPRCWAHMRKALREELA